MGALGWSCPQAQREVCALLLGLPQLLLQLGVERALLRQKGGERSHLGLKREEA